MIALFNLIFIPLWSKLRAKIEPLISRGSLLSLEVIISLVIIFLFNLYVHKDISWIWTDQILTNNWGFESSFLETTLSGVLFLLFLKTDSVKINLKNIILGFFFLLAFFSPSPLQYLVGALLCANIFVENSSEKQLVLLNITLVTILEILRVSLVEQASVLNNESLALFQLVITTLTLCYLLRFLKKSLNDLFKCSLGLVLTVVFFDKLYGQNSPSQLLEMTLNLFIIISFIYIAIKSFFLNRAISIEEFFTETSFVFLLFSLRFSGLQIFAIYLSGQILLYYLYKSLIADELTRLKMLVVLHLKLQLCGFPGSIMYLCVLSFIGFLEADAVAIGIALLTLTSLRTSFICARLFFQNKVLLEKEKWIKTDFWLLPISLFLLALPFILIPNSYLASKINITAYFKSLKLTDPNFGVQLYYLLLTLIVGVVVFVYLVKYWKESRRTKKVFSTAFDSLPEQLISSEKSLMFFLASSVGLVKRSLSLLAISLSNFFIFSITESLSAYHSSNRLKIKLAIVITFSAIITSLYLLRVM